MLTAACCGCIGSSKSWYLLCHSSSIADLFRQDQIHYHCHVHYHANPSESCHEKKKKKKKIYIYIYIYIYICSHVKKLGHPIEFHAFIQYKDIKNDLVFGRS